MDATDDGIPRHLRVALANAERAMRTGDDAALGTINESLQPLVDAAMARIKRLSDAEASRAAAVAALSALVNEYIANRDHPRATMFVKCITSGTSIPDYWRDAIEIVASVEAKPSR